MSITQEQFEAELKRPRVGTPPPRCCLVGRDVCVIPLHLLDDGTTHTESMVGSWP
jgi:hypothetical protein